VTSKAAFNAEEWSAVVEGPVLAGLRVVAAGRGGTIRESLATGQVYAEARRAHAESEFLDALVSSAPAVNQQQLTAGADLVAVGEERLREALRVIGEKGSAADLEAYKRFVLAVAQAAAEAHKEGGFIGIGGKRISAEEQAALDEIRAILDAQPTTRP
jgi:hypothetical protein